MNNNIKKLTLIILLGLLLRLIFIDSTLSYDEPYTMNVINSTNAHMFLAISTDVHPPVYFMLQKLWSKISLDITYLKAFNLILSLLSIIMIYKISSIFLKDDVSIFAAFLMAINPISIYYGTQLRMYSLLILISLISAYYIIKYFSNRKTSYLFICSIINIIGIYTHYYYIMLIFAQMLFYLLFLKDWKFIIIQSIHFVLVIPLFFFYLLQISNAHNNVYNYAIDGIREFHPSNFSIRFIFDIFSSIALLLLGIIETSYKEIAYTAFFLFFQAISIIFIYSFIKNQKDLRIKYSIFSFYFSYIIFVILSCFGIFNRYIAIRYLLISFFPMLIIISFLILNIKNKILKYAIVATNLLIILFALIADYYYKFGAVIF